MVINVENEDDLADPIWAAFLIWTVVISIEPPVGSDDAFFYQKRWATAVIDLLLNPNVSHGEVSYFIPAFELVNKILNLSSFRVNTGSAIFFQINQISN